MKNLSVKEVETIAFRLAQEHLTFNEPIPDFSSRFPNILESCLAVPFQKFSNQELYPSLVLKASILFYLMIKNHPFQNGNKRIAITTLLVFLAKNKKWLAFEDKQTLYSFTLWVAKSKPKEKDYVLLAIKSLISENLIKYNKST